MQLLINGYSIKKCFKKGEKKSPYDLFFDSKGCTSNQTHKDAQTQGQDSDMHLSSKTMNKTMQSKREYNPGDINIHKRG